MMNFNEKFIGQSDLLTLQESLFPFFDGVDAHSMLLIIPPGALEP